MQLRSLFTLATLVLSGSLVGAPTNSVAQTATPGQILTAMRTTNQNIDVGISAIQTRCEIQRKRKGLLEQENAKRTPDLSDLNGSKTILLAQQQQQNSVLMEKSRVLGELKARISQLEDDIKNSTKDTNTRLKELQVARDAAKKAALDAAKKLRALDDAYEALVLTGQATADGEASYLSVRAELVTTRTQQESIVMQKNLAIGELSLGHTTSLTDMKNELKSKQSGVASATAEQKAAQAALDGTKKKLRVVETQIAKLSEIAIPAIPSICGIIDQFTPAVQ